MSMINQKHFSNEDNHMRDFLAGKSIRGRKQVSQIQPDQSGQITFGSTVVW